MRKIFIHAYFLVFPVCVFSASHSSSHSDGDINSLAKVKATQIIMNSTPLTHKVRHGDLLMASLQDIGTASTNPLQNIFTNLAEEYLKASALALSNPSDPSIGRYLPDSLSSLGALENQAILFDREIGIELHVHPWQLKIDFFRLALYYAQLAKESLPTKLSVHRARAERNKNGILTQCDDPFETAAFENGHMVWKYLEAARKDLAFFAEFKVGIYQRLLEKEELFGEFLKDLAYNMSNGTVLRAASKHPLGDLMLRYHALSKIWNDRYASLRLQKKFPLPESLAKSRAVDESKFENDVYGEILELTEQIKTLQTINAHLQECGDIFSVKLDGISGSNITLKASGTAAVIDGVMQFTDKYHNFLYEIYFERFWRLISLVGTLMRVKSTISIPDLDDVFINAPHLTPTTLKRVFLDLALVKARADAIHLQALSEQSPPPKFGPTTTRSLLRSLLFRSSSGEI